MLAQNLHKRKADEMRYSNEYLYDDDKHKKNTSFHFRFNTRYIIVFGGVFVTMVLLLNVYQLYHLSRKLYGDTAFNHATAEKKKVAWIFAKKSSHLQHVIRVLDHAGYTTKTSLEPPDRWDLMWAYDFPFKKEFKDFLTNLKYDQKVNHLPGTGLVTLKVELARTKLRWVPQAFSIPKEKDDFIRAAEQNPSKLWVQKSNNHRGIKIVKSTELDLEAQSTFIQEFVDNPLLIDGKKFDIGIYVVYTSVNPLQVYIYEDDLLVRFCSLDYNPLIIEQTEKYVVADNYINIADMPSLKSYVAHGRMRNKDALFTYLSQHGHDVKHIWSEIQRCIGEMFIAKADGMDKSFGGYRTKHNFFELVRVDFALDDAGKVWLMEVNMSPNLSSAAHSNNALMYEQVVYNTLSLVGIASHIDERFDNGIKEVVVSERDIMLPNHQCKTTECVNSCVPEECSLCNHCLSDTTKTYLKKAFHEHMNKGGYARVLPSPLRPSSGDTIHVNFETTGELNLLMERWFKEKCKLNTMWCQ